MEKNLGPKNFGSKKTLGSKVGKQRQLLLQATEVQLGLQVGVEFDKS